MLKEGDMSTFVGKSVMHYRVMEFAEEGRR